MRLLAVFGVIVLFFAVAVLVAVTFFTHKVDSVVARATCTFDGSMNGTLVLEEFTDRIRVEGLFHDVPFGLHAIHVHEFGATSNHCADAGGPYNPTQVAHGGPFDKIRHVGDWGNIDVTGIPFMLIFSDPVARLTGDAAIVNRSIVIHKAHDDLGMGGTPNSEMNGSAGPPLACCVIREA